MNEYGDIAITQEKPHYYPGKQANGTIYVAIRKPFEAKNQVLKISGFIKITNNSQKIRVLEYIDGCYINMVKDLGLYIQKPTETSAIMGSKPQKLEENVLNYKFDIKDFSESILEVGQYVFPFTFVVPEDIPNTFNCSFNLIDKQFYRESICRDLVNQSISSSNRVSIHI